YYDHIGGGIDTVSGFGKITILGNSYTGRGIWYYYIVSLLFKTPISYFLFLLLSLFYLVKNTSLSLFIKNHFFLIIPVLYFLVILSFFYQTQCGIRHIIFIYPFFFILSGSVIANAKFLFQKALVFFASIFLIISVMKYYNNYYPYTNELIEDKTTANEYVGASNLNFGHGNLFYKKYMREHKDVKWVTERPEVGIFLITVDDYMDIWNKHQYDWITSFKPIGHVAHSALLIRVTEKDIEK
ncbi:MAG: hypothetical protein ABL872_18280, partial [Lacibacter sp.]